MVVTFQIRNRRGIDNVRRIIHVFPRAVDRAVDDFGFSLKRRLKRSLTTGGSRGGPPLIWNRTLFNSIRWNPKRKELTMVKHGVQLDTMRPHTVALKRGRRIRDWAFEKGNLEVKILAQLQKGIKVRAHPWIAGPTTRAIADLPKMIKRRTSRTVRSKGRRV